MHILRLCAGGSISYRELNDILRRRAGLPPMSLEERHKIITNSNTHALRKGASKSGKGLSADFSIKGVDDAHTFHSELQKALHKNLARVIDIFRDWDEDMSGTIDRKEFHRAIRALGFDAPRSEVDQLFNTYDKDGGGSIEYNEMNKMLRKEMELKAGLKAGAMGDIEAKARNKHALRKEDSGVMGADKRARTLQGTFLKDLANKGMVDQLALALHKKWARAKDLFMEWCVALWDRRHSALHTSASCLHVSHGHVQTCKRLSTSPSVLYLRPLQQQVSLCPFSAVPCAHIRDLNGDGEISRNELHKALGALGISVGGEKQSQVVANAMFDEIDADRSGLITMNELSEAVKPAAVSKRRSEGNPNPRRRFGWQSSQQMLTTPPSSTPCQPYRPLSAPSSTFCPGLAAASNVGAEDRRTCQYQPVQAPSCSDKRLTSGAETDDTTWTTGNKKGTATCMDLTQIVRPTSASSAVLRTYTAVGSTGWVRTTATPEWRRQLAILQRQKEEGHQISRGSTASTLIRVSSHNHILHEGMRPDQQHLVHITRPHAASSSLAAYSTMRTFTEESCVPVINAPAMCVNGLDGANSLRSKTAHALQNADEQGMESQIMGAAMQRSVSAPFLAPRWNSTSQQTHGILTFPSRRGSGVGPNRKRFAQNLVESSDDDDNSGSDGESPSTFTFYDFHSNLKHPVRPQTLALKIDARSPVPGRRQGLRVTPHEYGRRLLASQSTWASQITNDADWFGSVISVAPLPSKAKRLELET